MEYQNHIFIDVHSWVKEIEGNDRVPIVGAYRSSYLRAKAFTPAIFFKNKLDFVTNKHSFFVAISALEKYLGNPITTIYLDDTFEHCLWINSSVDHFCPFMAYEIPGMRKAAILHDTLALDGVYGIKNQGLFVLAIKHIEIFFYVSNTSLEDFRKRMESAGVSLELKSLVPMPNAHNLSDRALQQLKQSVTLGDRELNTSLSVSSIYPHKNIFRTIEVATHSLFDHYHVGKFCFLSPEEIKKYGEEQKIHYLESIDDKELMELYSEVRYFICMSKKEGFSLTPMEAILLGVPVVILSDIPVHREIYGRYSVNFVSPELGDMNFMGTKWKQITRTDRINLFQRFAFLNTLPDFVYFCMNDLQMDLTHYERSK